VGVGALAVGALVGAGFTTSKKLSAGDKKE
jgi:hypothetical protein